MKVKLLLLTSLLINNIWLTNAQSKTEIIDQIIHEVNNNSQLEKLGMELLDDIGPRLMGSTGMVKANDWVVNTYNNWGIDARNEKYGVWKGWERGRTEVVMTSPRYHQLSAIQLAWSPSTLNNKPIEGELLSIPTFKDSLDYVQWLSKVKGKIVLISPTEISGRPEANFKEFGTEKDYDQYVSNKKEMLSKWNNNLKIAGLNARTLPAAIEKAGAKAIVSSNWSGGWGGSKIFAARTESIPNIDVKLEDYQMLLRFMSRGIQPKLKITVESKFTGMQPAFNSIAEIRGVEKPDEYVFLSAHLDSWDGGTGATDNGTGVITMMEVMRVLKKIYPNPKRTIIVGHWGGEEQGLNGSRAYVEDHPEQLEKISVLFNQDNGTGRINWINGLGFLDAYDFLGRWMSQLPDENRAEIKTDFPGNPGGRSSSDYAAFLAHGVPSFFLIGSNWDYGTYTWHTQYDTYDKIVFSDVRKNVETIAIMVYLACEEPEMFSRRKAKLPFNKNTGKYDSWPEPVKANRDGNY